MGWVQDNPCNKPVLISTDPWLIKQRLNCDLCDWYDGLVIKTGKLKFSSGGWACRLVNKKTQCSEGVVPPKLTPGNELPG
jgi:hypothetical protein